MMNRSTGRTGHTRRTRTAATLLCATGIARSATACNEDPAQDGSSSESPAKNQQPSASVSKGTDQGDQGGDKGVNGDAGKTPTAVTVSADVITYARCPFR
ncbi:hypothetical protein [Streptomyces sp. NPDC005336]|uniref:hypothetical protein n=1 Tax=Streptomyces sp. NPDC005336 TaxID=3157035 RepID=UPI0033A8E904